MEQPTDKQIKFAKVLGIGDPESYSKKDLSTAIDGLANKGKPRDVTSDYTGRNKMTVPQQLETVEATGGKLSPSQKVSITSKCFSIALEMLDTDNKEGVEEDFYKLVKKVREEYQKIYESL